MFFNLPYLAAFVPYNIVPISELYAWSNNQKIHILFHKIAELVKATNDYDKIFDELQKLLLDFDDEVKDQITRLLQEMYDDGTLGNLVAQVLSTEIPTRTGDLDLSCMGWRLNKAHSYGYTSFPAQDAQITVDEEFYNYPQGNCVFEINGNKYWAVSCVCHNGSHFVYNNAARIYVFTINQDGSLSYVTDKEYGALGHCNGMTYLNGNLYITPNSYQVPDDTQPSGYRGQASTDVHKISFDGEHLSDSVITITLDYIEYPDVNNFYDNIYNFNGKLYVADAKYTIWEVVLDNIGTPTTEVILTEYREINGIGNGRKNCADGFAITEDYIYFGATIHRIKRYNKHTKVVDWTYQLPTLANNLQYKLGEVEDFTIVDNVIYLLGAYNLSGINTSINNYTMMRFYRQNIVTNEIAPTNNLNWSNGSVTRQVSLYVSGSVPNDLMGTKNVTGLNSDNGFACVQEALDFVESNFWISRANIVIEQPMNLSPIEIHTTKHITLSGTSYMNTHSTKVGGEIKHYVKPCVGFINILGGCNVQIDNLEHCNRLPSNLNNTNKCNVTCINLDNATLNISGAYFPSGLAQNASTVLYAINSARSVINLMINMTDYLDSTITGAKDTAFYAWEVNRESVIGGGVNCLYCNTFNSSVNTHNAIYYKNNNSGNYRNLYITADTEDETTPIINCHNSNFIG